MRFNRKEHCRFVQWLDRTAEKNPVLWLPCIILLAIILGLSSIAADIKTASVCQERIATSSQQKEMFISKKPFALRVVAITLVMAFCFMAVPEFNDIICMNTFAINTCVAENFICEISDNTVSIQGINDLTQLQINKGEIIIPSTIKIDQDTYTVTEIADNAFSNLTEIQALVIPKTISRIGENILSEEITQVQEDNCYLHIFCYSDSYAYSFLKEKCPEYMFILMDDKDFLPISVYQCDQILGAFGTGTSYKFLVSSKKPYEDMLSSFDDSFAFKFGITSWQTLTFESSDLVDIFKDEHDFYLTFLCEILQSRYSKSQFDLAEMSDITNLVADVLEVFNECDIDFKDRKMLTAKQSYELEKASVKLLKFDTSYIEPFKNFLKTGKTATEIIDIVCNMYFLSRLSNETVEFLNIMKQNTNNTSLKIAIDEVILSTADLPLLITEQIVLNQSEACIKKALGSIVNNLIEKNPACMALKLVRDGGQYIVNSVFSTDDIIKQYYTLKYFVELENIIRDSCVQVGVKFQNDRTKHNADLFLDAVSVYFQTMDYGFECMDKMAKIVYENSLMGWNADRYTSFHQNIVSMQNSLNNTYESYGYIYSFISNFYYSEYNIPVESIAFEKESVEWGLSDSYFFGHSCEVIPSNAKNKEIIYTTSDSSVAEIINGDVKVNGLGKCVITATSSDNPNAFDTLDVTVVEGSGNDSYPIIFPTEKDFKYTIENDEVTITNYIGDDTNVVIPDTISGMPVTTIGKNAFFGNKSIMSVSFPESLLSIESRAFDSCTGISSIYLPKGIKSLGQEAFGNTEISEVFIPKSLEICNCDVATNGNVYWSSGPFSGCSKIKSVIFEDGIAKIIPHLFSKCSGIEEIIIPETVTEIGDYAFSNCNNLRGINLENVSLIGSSAFSSCELLNNVEFSNNITYIGDGAFQGSGINRIIIPDSVKTIGGAAFSGCENASSIKLGNGLENVGWAAFWDCNNVSELFVNSDLGQITPTGYNYLFNGLNESCNLVIGDSMTSLTGRFYDTVLISNRSTSFSIYIGKNVNNIASTGSTNVVRKLALLSQINVDNDNPYYEADGVALYEKDGTQLKLLTCCNFIKSYTIKNQTTIIGEYAFDNCQGIESVIIPNDVSVIEENAFNGCVNLLSITIPQNVQKIGKSAFCKCERIEEITIPGNINEIDDYCFSECIGLRKVDIQSGVKSIGYKAFYNCPNLENIILPDSMTNIGDYAFDKTALIIAPEKCKFGKMPEEYLNIYKYNSDDATASVYSVCADETEVTIPEFVNGYPLTRIHDGAFANCSKINNIVIPDGVTTIGAFAFQNCSSLKKIVIPQSVTKFGREVFKDCDLLTIYGYRNSQAEKYAQNQSIPFVYLDGSDVPADTILELIKNAAENTVLRIDTTKYGTTLTANEISAAKSKNLTFEIVGNGFFWKIKAADLPDNTSVDFSIIIPSGENLPAEFSVPIEKYVDFAVKNPSGAVLTYNCGTESAGKNANIFTVSNGVFTYVDSIVIDANGVINFVPLNECSYFIAIDDNIITYLTANIKTYHISIPENVTVTRNNETLTNESILNTGDILTITANYIPGYQLKSLKANGIDIVNGATFTVENEDVSISVEYSILDNEHTHSFTDIWQSDSTYHWHECECGEKSDVSAHTEDSGIVTVQPTATSSGVKTYSCTVCGYVMRTESIPPFGEEHTHYFSSRWSADRYSHWHECECGEKSDMSAHTEDSGVVTVQPMAVSAGVMTYSCRVCGYVMRTVDIPPTGDYFDPYPLPVPPTPPTPIYPEISVVTTAPTEDEKLVEYPVADDIDVSLKCRLSGLSEGTARLITKKKFFDDSAIVSVSQTTSSKDAAKKAVVALDGSSEYNISYPFDITIYNAYTNDKMALRGNGYITLEIPVPKSLANYADDINVYHIADGVPELLESSIIISDESVKIHFTAYEFSPFMFNVHTEFPVEDIAAGAGTMANEVPIDAGIPVTNGVSVPNAVIPQNLRLSNKKRKYRILSKRRLDDLVFVY